MDATNTRGAIPCPVCGYGVNRNAYGCPNCGSSPRLSPAEAQALRTAMGDHLAVPHPTRVSATTGLVLGLLAVPLAFAGALYGPLFALVYFAPGLAMGGLAVSVLALRSPASNRRVAIAAVVVSAGTLVAALWMLYLIAAVGV